MENLTLKQAIKLGVGIYIGMLCCQAIQNAVMLIVSVLVMGMRRGGI